MPIPRLRQVVLAARDLDVTTTAIERALDVSTPFRDKGVGAFGLVNAVYAIGDTFLEVVSPTRPDTAAGRQLDRRGGDCGYMLMVEVDDEAALRQRLGDLGVRIVWETSHSDVVDLHLHPKDMPGAIVAVDVCTPAGSWRWGGPAWAGGIPGHGGERITGVTVAVDDPPSAARRWAEVVGLAADGSSLVLDGGEQRVDFAPASDARSTGIIAMTIDASGGPVTIAGVDVDRRPGKG